MSLLSSVSKPITQKILSVKKNGLRYFAIYLISCILVSSFNLAWADVGVFTNNTTNAGSTSSSAGITPKICPALKSCMATEEAAKQARDQYAKANSCIFLQDTCKKAPISEDNQGPNSSADASIFQKLWDGVSSKIKEGYEFTKGVIEGLKQQIADIIDLLKNLGEVIDGLWTLAKSLFNDPSGTLKAIGEMLGDEAKKTLAQATICGSYDKGYLIGSFVSPAVAFKLVTKLAKYGGKAADIAKEVNILKKEIGCASFIAGTLILTPQGSIPIDQIHIGNLVESRHEQLFKDHPQKVENTFGRIAPSYRALKTESEVIYLTDEHPLWVQGKGWVTARDIQVDEVLSAKNGDVLVLENIPIAKPVQVYNFSVDKTHNYFVGEAGLWAHNSFCDIFKPKDVLDTDIGLIKDKNLKGFKGELLVRKAFEDKGYTVIKAVDNTADNAIDGYKGKKGIDAIFKDKDGNYVIVESKATGGEKPLVPEDKVLGLATTKNGRQMSQSWINDHLNTMVEKGELSQAEADKIVAGFKTGTTKRVYAQTDAKGTTFNEIVDVGSNDAKIGKTYQLK